jgi:hypothetical protein
MGTCAENTKRLAHFLALYDQGDAQNSFSECIEQRLQIKMATYAEHAKRFAHLRALYDQGDAQNDFSECIEQCERSIELVQGSYWRIKTLCLLARCHQHDWKKAFVSIRSLDEPSSWSNT